MSTPLYVGIDVSKAQLDVALLPTAECWRTPNDEAGIADLVQRLDALNAVLVVLEATGGLERPLTAALVQAQLPVAVVNPRQVRDFARDRAAREDRSNRCGCARALRRTRAPRGARVGR